MAAFGTQNRFSIEVDDTIADDIEFVDKNSMIF